MELYREEILALYNLLRLPQNQFRWETILDMLRDNHGVVVRYLLPRISSLINSFSRNTLKRFVLEQPQAIQHVNPVPRDVRRDIHNAVEREVRRIE